MKHRCQIIIFLSLGALLAAQDWERGPRSGPAARQAWFYNQRAYPLGYIPAGARNDAIHQLERIDKIARQQRRGPVTAAAGRNASDALRSEAASRRGTNRGTAAQYRA